VALFRESSGPKGPNFRKHIITRYFRFIYVLGFCVVTYSLAFRLYQTRLYRFLNQLIVPGQLHRYLTAKSTAYIVDISHYFQTIGFFSTFGIHSEFLITENLLASFANGFISGLSARFGNFAKWTDFVLSKKQRLKELVWDLYFQSHVVPEVPNLQLAALLLHKYQYKSIIRVPRILLTLHKPGLDFFLPLSKYATRLETFFLLFLLLKIHLFFRNRIASDRLFWTGSSFETYYKEKNLGISNLSFDYVFRLYGRNHKAMQLWEYESINTVFQQSSARAAQLKSELYKNV
jgi:hypothetical protein